MIGVSLMELNAWLGSQLAAWQEWRPATDSAWLALPTGNERFPDLGSMFRHAFTPLRRYADQAAGREPADDNSVNSTHWPALLAWAVDCVGYHRAACQSLVEDAADEPMEFRTRSAGVMLVSRRLALTHAATHCFWHLGGIAHLLRREGIAPPQRSDLIFWAAQQSRTANSS